MHALGVNLSRKKGVPDVFCKLTSFSYRESEVF